MRAQRVRVTMVATAVAAVSLLGCSSDGSEGSGPATTTTAPVAGPSTSSTTTLGEPQEQVTVDRTPCAEAAPEDDRTIAVLVAEGSEISAQAPPGLTAGLVRVELDADADNSAPAEITVTRDGEPVLRITGVPAGEACGLDASLDPGSYVVSSTLATGSGAGFTVVSGS